jgi:hypothetical protein
MKNFISSWFRNLTAFDSEPLQKEFSVFDPTSADPKGLSTLILAVTPSSGPEPTIISLRFSESGIKLFEKKYDDDASAQEEMQAIAKDLDEASTLSRENKKDEAKNLMNSLIEKYKRHSDNIVQEQPPVTTTQAAAEIQSYKGWAIHKREDGSWLGEYDVMALKADSLDTLKAKIDNAVRKAYGKKLKRNAAISQSNWFFDTVDEAMEFQERMKELQGPEVGEGKPLWDQVKEEPKGEELPEEEDTTLAPPSLSYQQIEKDKAKTEKDIGKRIKEQVKTEVESALDQKSASVFGKDDEELVKALRLPNIGRNWDEIKKYFVKELSRNEDDTSVFLDSLRQKEEGGKPEGLPLPPKPPEDLVSPETHDKLVKEVEDKSEPKPELKPELKPLEDEIARADNAEIRKVAALECRCGHDRNEHGMGGSHKCSKCECKSFSSKINASQSKVAINPLQEPPAVGQAPGMPLSAPVEEAPTFDAPVVPEPDVEPELLEEPQSGDRVYVMGDYETGNDGFEGTMVSTYTSKGDEYAVIAKDDGDNEEVALHRVVKASQKKVAKAYYEKTAKHEHDYQKGESSSVVVCPCGAFKFTEDYLKENPPIIEQKEADLEVESKSNEDVIRMFISNAFPKDKMPVWGTENLKITKYPNGWALVNYQTPILYRTNDSDTIHFNTKKYSVTTSKIQNQIRSMFTGQPVKETDEAGIYSAIDQSNLAKDPELHPELKQEPTLESLHESALTLKAELEKVSEEDVVGLIMEYEGGELSTEDTLKLFSILVKNQMVWSLQGHYGRTAQALIDASWLDEQGNILKHPSDVEASLNKKAASTVELPIRFVIDDDSLLAYANGSIYKNKIDKGEMSDADWQALIKDTAHWMWTMDRKSWREAYFQDAEWKLDPEQINKVKTMFSVLPAQSSQELKVEKKAEVIWVLQGNYGQGWEDLTAETSHEEILQRKKEYIENEPGTPLRIKREIEKQAQDPVPAPEAPKEEIPTKFKELKISPPKIEKERAIPATPEQSELIKSVESSLDNLNQIKSFIDQAKIKFNEEIRQIQEKGGQVTLEAELKDKIEKLSKLIEATESKLVYYGDKFIALKQEVKEVPFKPTEKWQLQKLLEKFEGAQAYLDKAIQGAQSLATQESVRELYFFPKRMSKLHRTAGLMETLSKVYDDVLNALKNIIGSEPKEESPKE